MFRVLPLVLSAIGALGGSLGALALHGIVTGTTRATEAAHVASATLVESAMAGVHNTPPDVEDQLQRAAPDDDEIIVAPLVVHGRRHKTMGVRGREVRR